MTTMVGLLADVIAFLRLKRTEGIWQYYKIRSYRPEGAISKRQSHPLTGRCATIKQNPTNLPEQLYPKLHKENQSYLEYQTENCQQKSLYHAQDLHLVLF